MLQSFLGNQLPLTFQRLFQVQVTIVYIYAALQKVSWNYLNGTVLEFFMRDEFLRGRAGGILESMLSESALFALMDFLYSGRTFMILAIFSVVLEFFLPLALWYRKTRTLAIIVGAGFHIFLYFAMDVFGFSLAMIGTYLFFIDQETLVTRVRTVLTRDRAGLELKVQT